MVAIQQKIAVRELWKGSAGSSNYTLISSSYLPFPPSSPFLFISFLFFSFSFFLSLLVDFSFGIPWSGRGYSLSLRCIAFCFFSLGPFSLYWWTTGSILDIGHSNFRNSIITYWRVFVACLICLACLSALRLKLDFDFD
jgi:hypothetical protein